MSSLRSRVLAVAAAALMGMLVPGVAQAAPPDNDDFAASTPIAALPFTVEQDTSEATEATDDPYWCQSHNVQGSVWYHYTATEDAILRATSAGSDRNMIISAQTGERGQLSGVDNSCTTGARYPATFRVTAGTTYYFMISGYDSPGGALKFSLDKIAPAANDNFAAAQPIGALPFTAAPDQTVASFEADEPESSCVYNEQLPSLWYSYTPTTSVSVVPAAKDTNEAAVTVYTGADITSLKEVGCVYGNSTPKAIRAEAGTTYYVRFTAPHFTTYPVSLSLTEAPPLQPYIYVNENSPSVFHNITFSPESNGWWIDDPLTAEWDFGDGAKVPATQDSVQHQYKTDGTYVVTMRATTPDGRTGTSTREMKVETHDVGITKFSVPTSAQAGQSKPITVSVANTRYLEKATVTLYRSDGDSWDQVGQAKLDVPAHRWRTVQVPFSYSFTPEDAAVGKVSFRAVVSLEYPVRDARPADNEVIAIATTVRPASSTTAVAS